MSKWSTQLTIGRDARNAAESSKQAQLSHEIWTLSQGGKVKNGSHHGDSPGDDKREHIACYACQRIHRTYRSVARHTLRAIHDDMILAADAHAGRKGEAPLSPQNTEVDDDPRHLTASLNQIAVGNAAESSKEQNTWEMSNLERASQGLHHGDNPAACHACQRARNPYRPLSEAALRQLHDAFKNNEAWQREQHDLATTQAGPSSDAASVGQETGAVQRGARGGVMQATGSNVGVEMAEHFELDTINAVAAEPPKAPDVMVVRSP
ncbi:hypothetical protein LTR85_003663 [Meristemomyces frigidus]|nr:hypothetical protein LTR85_003663 [Meristemomyces frigidus]